MVDLILSDEDNMVGLDEQLIYSGNLHYIILIKAVLWFIFFLLLALYIPNIFWNWGRPNFIIGGEFLGSSLFQYMFNEPPTPDLITIAVWLASSISLFLAVATMLYYIKIYYSSHLTITDARLIIKTGLIFVHIQEIEIEEIKEIKVSSGILGSFLNYGYIHIDMRFVGEAHVPCVPRPFEFVKKLHEKHERLRDDIETVLSDKS